MLRPWLDPAEAEGLITPFMVYYAIHEVVPSVSRSELFELNALHLHQDDQALELGALDVIAGSGVEIRGYGERGSDESRQIRSEV